MNILVIGSGGREHTLVWKIRQSPKVNEIYAAPGNAGIAQMATCVPIDAEDLDGLLTFALDKHIDLTVVGPEAPLTLGIVDRFQEHGLVIFGPSQAAAQIEGSKAFAKDLMRTYNIPTAAYQRFTSSQQAHEYIQQQGAPIVVKADGLAAGKGSIVCPMEEEAHAAIRSIMEDRIFGEAGREVVIEEFMTGEEASILALTDGRTIRPLVPSQDHKPIGDGDQGPNTGGMGAYAPAPVITPALSDEIMRTILRPTIDAMSAEGRPYRGVLYAGLMISNGHPRVVEFNCRFGDPELQVVLPFLKTDLVDLMTAVIEGRLHEVPVKEDPGAAVCVVMASGGYPGSYEKGKVIHGLKEVERLSDVLLFHAGTALKDSEIITNGGRVLGVTAVAPDIQSAIHRAYEAVHRIHFENAYYRSDIGHRALARLKV